jgi:hypothetical protein
MAIRLVLLALTAALVVTVPARQPYLRRFTRTMTATGLRVSVRIDADRRRSSNRIQSGVGTDGVPARSAHRRNTVQLAVQLPHEIANAERTGRNSPSCDRARRGLPDD